MKHHIVVQGECLTRIAWRHGFRSARVVYEHPANEDLRRERPNPNVLLPGDRVAIPDLNDAPVSAATTELHRFVLHRPRKELRLTLRDAKRAALANTAYELEIDGEIRTGETDPAGVLKEGIPWVERAVLRVAGRTFVLRLGFLDPSIAIEAGSLSGVRSRLRNLGYDVGRGDRGDPAAFRSALALFQADNALTVTGEPDEATCRKLESVHGS